jgi:hypothetical protein
LLGVVELTTCTPTKTRLLATTELVAREIEQRMYRDDAAAETRLLAGCLRNGRGGQAPNDQPGSVASGSSRDG